MSLDPVQVMKGQDPMPKTCPSAPNGDSQASWDASKDIHENVGSTKKPKSVSVPFVNSHSVCASYIHIDNSNIHCDVNFPIASAFFLVRSHICGLFRALNVYIQ